MANTIETMSSSDASKTLSPSPGSVRSPGRARRFPWVDSQATLSSAGSVVLPARPPPGRERTSMLFASTQETSRGDGEYVPSILVVVKN